MGEIEAKVDGFAEAVEAIVFAKEAHERHQAKEEVPDSILDSSGIRVHSRRVRESTGTNAPRTAFTSRVLRGELIGYQPVLDVGVQVHTDEIRAPKERYVTVSRLRGRRRPQRVTGMMATTVTVALTKQIVARTERRRKALPAITLTRSRRCHY